MSWLCKHNPAVADDEAPRLMACLQHLYVPSPAGIYRKLELWVHVEETN